MPCIATSMHLWWPKFFINHWNLHNPYVKLTSVVVTYPQNHLLTRRSDWSPGALLGLKNHPCESQTSSKQCISATYGVKKAFMWAQSPLEGSSLQKFFINQWNLDNPHVKLTSVMVTYPQNHLLTRRSLCEVGALLCPKNHPCESQTKSKQCISGTDGVNKAFIWGQWSLEDTSLPKFFTNFGKPT